MTTRSDDQRDTTCPGCGADESECACENIPEHACTFRGTWGAEGSWDECDICGRRKNESRYSDGPESIDWDGREYDFEGGGEVG